MWLRTIKKSSDEEVPAPNASADTERPRRSPVAGGCVRWHSYFGKERGCEEVQKRFVVTRGEGGVEVGGRRYGYERATGVSILTANVSVLAGTL